MTIYTLGYSGWKIEDVEAVLDRLDAVLVDVRMVPRSRIPTWNVGVLGRRFGPASTGSAQGRYLWLREFGNRNYKGGPIDIVDFPAGQAKLAEITACHGDLSRRSAAETEAPRSRTSGRAIVLLCGCADVKVCHRKLLAEWLAQAWRAEVEHLTRPDNQVDGGQKKLF